MYVSFACMNFKQIEHCIIDYSYNADHVMRDLNTTCYGRDISDREYQYSPKYWVCIEDDEIYYFFDPSGVKIPLNEFDD